jgi:hypothetical protein
MAHEWWTAFGSEIVDSAELTPVLAKELASLAADGALPGIILSGLRQSTDMGYAGVCLDIEVERPQDLAYPIRAVEPVAVLFPFSGGQPSVLALRDDFPDTPHQNWSPPNMPCALCIDDRPWAEARLSATARDIARRIQLWLAKAARGDLHDTAQPLDPLFLASSLGLILPATALADVKEPVELAGFLREDNQNLILSRPMLPSDNAPTFTVLAFQAQPQAMARMRHAPRTLAALAADLEKCGVDLIRELKTRLKEWSGLTRTDVRRLSSRLAIVVAFPVAAGERKTANDIRAFLTFDAAGEIGVSLGVLHTNNSQVGDKRAYMVAIPEGEPGDQDLRVEPAQVHFTLDRELAAAISGHPAPDRRRALLVGAGSLGSQLSVNLAREGMFTWTVVDDDHILPHNLVRHALFADDVGAPKADALAYHLGGILGEPVPAIRSNILTPDDAAREKLTAALAAADLIIDASASVAASRHLSKLPEVKGRRISTFFNPAGTALVLLAENVDRSITLQDLEAQYHRLVISDPKLVGHLSTGTSGVRYSGSCRALTNRIPASRAALLSALASRGIVDVLASDNASISIWALDSTGDVRLIRREGVPVIHVQLGTWKLAYDIGLLANLAALRRRKLPHETGGVLLGIADMSSKSVHIAHALPEPEDSQATQTGFERGVVGLLETINQAVAASMYQLRYVGEWHSHPDRASAMPSAVDLVQLAWLGQELEKEGLPGLMAIAAQDGGFTFTLSRPVSTDEDGAE